MLCYFPRIRTGLASPDFLLVACQPVKIVPFNSLTVVRPFHNLPVGAVGQFMKRMIRNQEPLKFPKLATLRNASPSLHRIVHKIEPNAPFSIILSYPLPSQKRYPSEFDKTVYEVRAYIDYSKYVGTLVCGLVVSAQINGASNTRHKPTSPNGKTDANGLEKACEPARTRLRFF